MIEEKEVKFFQEKILEWYKVNGRSFPWRHPEASNYLKIISEVLLQRTKAETVNNYLPRFLEQYPSWETLWAASEDQLKESLKPLGLQNQRGARLYKLAQELKKRKGSFPQKKQEVEEMSMMGQYIANAYELFILKKPAPLLDVNMARVLERYFGSRKLADIRYDPYLQDLAKRVVNRQSSQEINWAILDLGGLVCVKQPKCSYCPLKSNCKFYLDVSI